MKNIHDLTLPADLMKETLMFMKEGAGTLAEASRVDVREAEGSCPLPVLPQAGTSFTSAALM